VTTVVLQTEPLEVGRLWMEAHRWIVMKGVKPQDVHGGF